MNNRDKKIDVLKGIAIILMVLGHAHFPYNHFINLFHMAVFFIASGYFFKDEYTNTFQGVFKYIKKKIKTLYVPFVICNLVFLFFNNLFFNFNLISAYSDDRLYVSFCEYIKKIVLILGFHGAPRFGGATWFLQTLFAVTCSYIIIDYLLKKVIHKKNNIILGQGVVSIVFLLIGYFCSIKCLDLYGLERLFSYYILYYIGILISKYNIFYEKYSIIELIVSFFILLLLNFIGTNGLSENNYINPFFLLISSIAGWIFLYSLSYYLLKIKILGDMFIIVGRNTLSIVILHLLSFKIVSIIMIKIYNMPIYKLSDFPVIEMNNWWILYGIIGTCIPIFLNMSLKILSNKAKMIYNKCNK